MRSLLQSEIVVWFAFGYVVFVYGLMFFYGSKAASVDCIEQSTTAGACRPCSD